MLKHGLRLSLSAALIMGLLMGMVTDSALAGGGAAPAPAPARATFQNPVLDENFPDPAILRVGKTYHAYSTNSGGNNVPHATSPDLVHWQVVGDAMPLLPRWARGGRTWAPEVAQIGGRFALYFTARDDASGRQCIGVAVADSPGGPFVDSASQPLVCQVSEGGSIDASPFQDAGGERYLLWKNDGNCCNQSTNIYVQPLSADGLKLTGKATSLIQNFQLWEGNVIEAPTLHHAGGAYYLLYSAGPYDSALYAVGYATAASVMGPYTKAPENPIFVSAGEVAGPGHQTVIADGAGRTWLAYHAWTAGLTSDAAGGYRSLRLEPVTFAGGRVTVGQPTLTPQQAPTP